MNIQSVNDKAFEVYGRVVDGYDYAELLATLEKCSEKPADSVIYVPGCLLIYWKQKVYLARSVIIAMVECQFRSAIAMVLIQN